MLFLDSDLVSVYIVEGWILWPNTALILKTDLLFFQWISCLALWYHFITFLTVLEISVYMSSKVLQCIYEVTYRRVFRIYDRNWSPCPSSHLKSPWVNHHDRLKHEVDPKRSLMLQMHYVNFEVLISNLCYRVYLLPIF